MYLTNTLGCHFSFPQESLGLNPNAQLSFHFIKIIDKSLLAISYDWIVLYIGSAHIVFDGRFGISKVRSAIEVYGVFLIFF